MKKIVIQAGHINCQFNEVVSLRKSTGAPGEQEINKRIADRLSYMLRQRGFEVVQTDANANSDTNITKQDYDLFLALHCDADYAGDAGSGFADFPEPSTDGATAESQRICKTLNETYFPETQIVYKNHSNENTRYYYMWKYLTAKTPCVLIEMGQAQDPHDKVLLGNTDLIASALTRSICKAFGVAYDLPTTPTPVPTPPPIDYVNQIQKLNETIEQLKIELNKAQLDLVSQLADKDVECQKKIDTFKNYLTEEIKEYK